MPSNSGGRSFAFNVQAPTQRQSGLSAAAPKVGTRGGENTGGVQYATPQSDYSGQSQLPAFIEEALAPDLQRRQKEQFLKGMAAAVDKQAVNDIHENTPSVSRIFGPSHYEQGAAQGYSNAAVNKAFTDLALDPELPKLSPEQVAQRISAMSDELTTADPATNILVQAAVMDRSVPFMESYSQKAYKYRQDQAYDAKLSSMVSDGTLFDQAERDYASLSPNDQPNRTGIRDAAKQSFLGGLKRLAGQSDESYNKVRVGAARMWLEQGNYFAFNTAREAGLFSDLDGDVQEKLFLHSDTLQRRAVKEIAANDPAIIEAAAVLHVTERKYDEYLSMTPAQQADARAKGYIVPAPMEMRDGMQAINDRLQRSYGLDVPLYDFNDQLGGVNRIVDALANSAIQQNNAERAAARSRQEAFNEKEAEAQQKAVAANMNFRQGSVYDGIVNGQYGENEAKIVLSQAWASGNIEGVVRAHERDGANLPLTDLSNRVRRDIQLARGKGVTTGFQKSLETFVALNQRSEMTARALYGDDFDNMEMIASQAAAGFPVQAAFQNAFDPDVARQDIDFHTVQELDKAFKPVLDKFDSRGWFAAFDGKSTLNDSAREAVTSAAYNVIRPRLKGSTIPNEAMIKSAIEQAQRNGTLDVVGEFAWQQRAGSKSMSQSTGLPNDVLRHILPQYLDQKLAATGFDKSGDTAWQVYQMQSGNEVRYAFIAVDPDDGKEAVIAIKPSDLVGFKKAKDKQTLDNADTIAGVLEGNGKSFRENAHQNMYHMPDKTPKPIDGAKQLKRLGKFLSTPSIELPSVNHPGDKPKK